MLRKISTIIESSRIYSLPMSIMSWLIIFIYAALESGDIWNGILAGIGISFAHLGTNVIDDYFDYRLLIKQLHFDEKEYIKNSQNTKCRYIISGRMTPTEVLCLAFIYFAIAALIGLILYFRCGVGVIYFALAGGAVGILYPLMSRIKLSELAVALAYGPLLFGGMYYVMTETYSWEVFLLGIPPMLMTVVLLYIHTVMDYDYDTQEGKMTLANSFNSSLDSLVVLKVLLILAYISPLLLCIFDILDWQVFFVALTIPLAVDLYNSMVDFSTNPESVPAHKWYHFPMENMKSIEKMNAQSFMIRMYQSRNLMIYFSLFMSLAVILAF